MRGLRWIGSILLIVVVALVGVFLWYRQASLPTHEGTFIVSGVGAPIEVVRDGHGVPHVRAQSERDALFALGYVHAQDRLWQMEFNRRIAQGRLSEILGDAGLDTDRFLRTLGVYHTAQQVAAQLDPDTRALLDAYAAGVNAYVSAARAATMPPEFLITRAPPPQAWQPADSIAWAIMMAWDLSRTYLNELARLRLAARLSKAEIDEFRPPYPGEPPLVATDYVDLYRVLGLFAGGRSALNEQAAQIAAAHPVAGFGDGEGIGSNNWVVAGSRTTSGKPLLANDPHLGLTTPSVWYFARLQAPGFEVFGATLPGVPYVLLGRNARVAWGFTNTGPDVQDLYLERINPANPDEYQTPGGYARFDVRDETIRVRGRDDVRLKVRSTRHGPVLSGVSKSFDQALPGQGPPYVLALRWAALEPGDATLRALRGMNRAANADEFVRALRDFGLVQQSIVFADVDGTIGMVAPARVPLRRADNDLKGLVPAPGWDERYDWQGWIPFDELPRIINPPSGFIVTANHRITPPGYRPFLTSEWYLPYRANRITQLIEATPKHSLETFRRIQGDVVSLAARDQLAALKNVRADSAAAKLALERLRAWDGGMRVDAPEPLILHSWLAKLRQRVFADELGSLAAEYVQPSELTQALLNVLNGATRARDWCDDVTTRSQRETCDEQAGAALEEAVQELGAGGRDLLGLRWGDVHRSVHEHRPLSGVAVLRDAFQLSVPVPGDSFTVNVGQLNLRSERPFSTRHAASLRAVYDLAPARTGAWVYTTGQVGNPFADSYGSLLTSWQKVELVPLQWERPKPGAQPATTMHLRPAAAGAAGKARPDAK
jgi:penicillin amidase